MRSNTSQCHSLPLCSHPIAPASGTSDAASLPPALPLPPTPLPPFLFPSLPYLNLDMLIFPALARLRSKGPIPRRFCGPVVIGREREARQGGREGGMREGGSDQPPMRIRRAGRPKGTPTVWAWCGQGGHWQCTPVGVVCVVCVCVRARCECGWDDKQEQRGPMQTRTWLGGWVL